MWPFKRSARVETRQSADDYTGLILQAIYNGALGTTKADPLTGAAVEIAAGLWARAFSMADGGGVYFPRHVMGWIGRSLVCNGEAVALIDPGQPLVPVAVTSVTGGAAEETWRYETERVGPSETARVFAPGSAVVHARYAISALEPWRGISPLRYAATTGELMAGLERALAWEAGANVGYVLPTPYEPDETNDDGTSPVDAVTAKPRNLRGKMALVHSNRSIAATAGAAPQHDWRPQRLGANPPDSLVELRYSALASMLSVMGVPPALAGVTNTAIAPAGLREAWRVFLHGTIQPVADLVAEEAATKLGIDASFSFDRLFASDLQGRARSFQSMVNGGMDVTKAAALAGLMQAEDG